MQCFCLVSYVDFRFVMVLLLFQNPTEEEFIEVVRASEAATWPNIARIRAHCLVEITLDHCVQRLRKRLTDELDAEQIAAMEKQGNSYGRHDSFFTTKSLVNLSGLSVSDPAPQHQMFLTSRSRDHLHHHDQHQQHPQHHTKSPRNSFTLGSHKKTTPRSSLYGKI